MTINDDVLPLVRELRDLTAKARAAALADFPDLEGGARTRAKTIKQGHAWAVSVSKAIGSTSSWQNEGLLDWFGWSRGSLPEHWSGRDLLGYPPQHLAEMHNLTPPTDRFDGMAWPAVVHNLRLSFLSVRSKVLQLCQWVDDQLDNLEAATYPMVRVVKSKRRKDSWDVEVTLAGVPVQAKPIGKVRQKQLWRLSEGHAVTFKNRSDYARDLKFLAGLLVDVDGKHLRKRLTDGMNGRITFD